MTKTTGKIKVREVYEAIAKMQVACDERMEKYEMCSARSVLTDLGYGSESIRQILEFIADGGFDYCLDAKIRMTGHDNEYPDWEVCYWGPDQLKSRLSCLSNVPYEYRHPA